MTRRKVFGFLFIWFFLSILVVSSFSDHGFIANKQLKTLILEKERVLQSYIQLLSQAQAKSDYLQSEMGLLESARSLGYVKPGTKVWYFTFEDEIPAYPFEEQKSDSEEEKAFAGINGVICILIAFAITTLFSLTMSIFLKFNQKKEETYDPE